MMAPTLLPAVPATAPPPPAPAADPTGPPASNLLLMRPLLAGASRGESPPRRPFTPLVLLLSDNFWGVSESYDACRFFRGGDLLLLLLW